MFEREITDLMFVQRWGIVRTLIPQSVAEHTYAVAMYANDIGTFLEFGPELHLAVLQYSLWHDARDEIFSGDLPGPNKRGLLDAVGPGAKEAWDAKLHEWSDRVFSNLTKRSGGKLDPDAAITLLLTVKAADWLEASVRMATEAQMGNGCAQRHIEPNLNGAVETAVKLLTHMAVSDLVGTELINRIRKCVHDARHGQSQGPYITREDESRTYHDPAVATGQ